MTVARVERERQQAAERTETAPGQQWSPVVSTGLQQFAADARAAYTTAQSIAKTPFVPTSYKTRGTGQNKTYLDPEAVAANVTAAWLAGEEIGLRPMQSLAAIDIIEGRPALNAQSMRALLQSHGHEIWVEQQPVPNTPLTQFAVTVAGRRKGDPDSRIQRVTWTWNRARQAGLVGKQNWEKHPVEMLIARATSAVCRLIASDVLMGLAYSAEEMSDELGTGEDAAATTGTVKRRGSTGVGRGAVQERPALSVAPEEPEPEERPTQEESEEAQEERGRLEPEPEPQQPEPQPEPEVVTCGSVHADGRRCQREPGHDGKHYYGRKGDAPAQQQEEPRGKWRGSEGAAEALQDPAVSSEPLQGEPQAVADYTPTEEERAAAQEGPEQEGYPDPSQEELDAVWEQEQAERAAREAESRAEAESARQSADSPPEEQPADDDPWADFR